MLMDIMRAVHLGENRYRQNHNKMRRKKGSDALLINKARVRIRLPGKSLEPLLKVWKPAAPSLPQKALEALPKANSFLQFTKLKPKPHGNCQK